MAINREFSLSELNHLARDTFFKGNVNVSCIEAGADVYIQKSSGATAIFSVLHLFLHEDLEPLAQDIPASARVAKH